MMPHTFFSLPLLLCLVADVPAQRESLPAPQVSVPKGVFQSVWLTLERAREGGADLPLYLTFRDGKGGAFWYAAPMPKAAHNLRVESNTLHLADGKLEGRVQGRMVKTWAPIADVGEFDIELTGKVDRGLISGTYALRFGKTKSAGKFTGTVSAEDVARKQNALAAGKDWPAYYGVNYAFRGPDSGIRLIEDLQKARPVWKAEEPMPCLWGKGPDARYAHRACVTGCAGGASSPVVAGGLVFVYYYQPTGSVGEKPLPFAAASPRLSSEKAIREFAAKHTSSALGQQAMVDWYRPHADDVVVALDAATGKTVWRTVLANRSGNVQTHKWRGYNPTPTVADGVVYVQGYGNRLYALEAGTGKLLWEHAGAATREVGRGGRPGATGPVVLGGLVVFSAGSHSIALDRKTGAQVWRAPGGNLLVWRSKGGDRLIACRGRPAPLSVACLDPKTGKALWTAKTPYSTTAGTTVHPILDGDLLLGFDVTVKANVAARAEVIALRLKADGLEEAWRAPAPVPMTDTYGLASGDGRVYIDGEKETFCLSLSDGKKLAALPGVGGARTQVAFIAEGRLFIQPEGRHGGQSFFMVNGDPGDFRLLSSPSTGKGNHGLSGQWFPPHPHDTAYANQPVINPLVDGRLFVRGHDGLYCYDLRKR